MSKLTDCIDKLKTSPLKLELKAEEIQALNEDIKVLMDAGRDRDLAEEMSLQKWLHDSMSDLIAIEQQSNAGDLINKIGGEDANTTDTTTETSGQKTDKVETGAGGEGPVGADDNVGSDKTTDTTNNGEVGDQRTDSKDGGRDNNNGGIGELGQDGAGSKGDSGTGMGDVGAGERKPGEGSGSDIKNDIAAVQNYRITNPESLVGGGQKTKFAKNKLAIETYLKVSDENRVPTNAEKDAIASYIGWGSFGQELFNGSWDRPAPKEGWEEADAWLRQHLGKEKWMSAQASIVNAHYTDPFVVSSIWDMLAKMGFTGGRVLEPSMGIGNFFGLMPQQMHDNSQLTGIELDSITAGMAQMLYPKANIMQKGYQDSIVPDGFYDLIVGNWPFASIGPSDKRYNALSPTLHDYFFLKALDQVRIGGLVVGITSAGTMDKVNAKIRLEMASKAEVVAVIRLPAGAFKSYAGTSVVTDLIILKRVEKKSLDTPEWINSEFVKLPDGNEVKINSYFQKHPENILGELAYGANTAYGAGMTVKMQDDYEQKMQEAIDRLPENTYDKTTGQDSKYVLNENTDLFGSVSVDTKGELWISRGEQKQLLSDVVKLDTKGNAKRNTMRRNSLKKLVRIRVLRQQVVYEQMIGDINVEQTRTALRAEYRAFVAEFGFVNDSDALTILRKAGDPNVSRLASLERNTAKQNETPVWTETAILTRPTSRSVPRSENPTMEDAYVYQRSENLDLDLDRIAELAKKDVETIKNELLAKKIIYKTPVGSYEHADIYLSGNVRNKLYEAEEAVKAGNKDMQTNVEDLKKVVPDDIPYYKIELRFGASFVPSKIYEQFVYELLGQTPPASIPQGRRAPVSVWFGPGGWRVRMEGGIRNAQSMYMAPGIAFDKLLQHALKNTPAVIWDKDNEGNRFIDEKATELANEKIRMVKEYFSMWAWKDILRRKELEKIYNDTLNNSADPKFNGSFLTFAGMMLEVGTSPFNLRSHQTSAIARGVILGRGLWAHEVGTGKTFTIGGIAIESKRYGKCKKPLLLAHNANSATVAAEIQDMYPQAKILYIEKMNKANRADIMQQVVTEDWDLIVVPHSQAHKFGLRKETYDSLASQEIADLEAAIWEALSNEGLPTDVDLDNPDEVKKMRSYSAKELVRARNAIKKRIADAVANTAEEGVSMEEAGIDMILVDEAHEFKKAPVATSMKIKGLAKEASDRAVGLNFLLQYISGINGGRNVHMFTGTPITNTLSELFVQMRYVMAPEMKRDGILHWDQWFNAFAQELSEIELTPAGEYKAISRLAAFANVPELRRLAGRFMDTVFADDMPEFKPRSINGKTISAKDLTPEERDFLENGRTEKAIGRPYKVVRTIVSPLTEEQIGIRDYLRMLSRRWDSFSKREKREAILSGAEEAPNNVMGKAFKAGKDVRLVDMSLPDNPKSKVNVVINNVLDIYKSHDLACQAIFMDNSFSDTITRTDKAGNKRKDVVYNMAGDIVNKLIAGGVKESEIMVVTGEVDKLERKRIAQMMNKGELRVVIGSTGTLGTGVNMQDNLRAMHHVDCPWMPGELEQRNGRGWRQGNQWNTVLEFRYVTENLDVTRWQTLVRKYNFIQQFLRGNDKQRVIEGEAADMEEGSEKNDLLSTMADAAGDPRILQSAKIKKDIEKIYRRQRLFEDGLLEAAQSAKILETVLPVFDRGLEIMRQTTAILENGGYSPFDEWLGSFPNKVEVRKEEEKDFSITLWGQEYKTRKDAGEAFRNYEENEFKDLRKNLTHNAKWVKIGSYKGLVVWAQWVHAYNIQGARLSIVAVPFGVDMTEDSLSFMSDMMRSDSSMGSIDAVLRQVKNKLNEQTLVLESKKGQLAKLKESLNEKFPQEEQLAKLVSKRDKLLLDMDRNPVPAPAWLRSGTPTDTNVFFNGDEYIVDGHLWQADDTTERVAGWYVILVEQGAGALDQPVFAPYMDVEDEYGTKFYEERTFEKPSVTRQVQNQNVQTPPASVPPPSLKNAATNLANGLSALNNGLTQVFGGGKMGMNAFLPDFDEETYQKAKPYFIEALNSFIKAGKEMTDFFVWALENFGEGARIYLEKFREELKVQPKPQEPFATGLRRSVATTERMIEGLPPEVQAVSREFPELVDKAHKLMNDDPLYAQNLLDSLKMGGKTLTDLDVAVLTIEKARRIRARNVAAANVVDADSQRHLELANSMLYELFDVMARGEGKAITETARALNALKMMVNSQYSLAEMAQAVWTIKKRPLSNEEWAELDRIKAENDRLVTKLDFLRERFDKEMSETKEELSKALANLKFAELTAQIAIGPKTEFRRKMLRVADKLDLKADQMLAEFRTRAGSMSFLDPTIVVAFGIKGAAVIIRGSVKFSDWLSEIKTEYNLSDDELRQISAESEKQVIQARANEDDERAKVKAAKSTAKRDKASVGDAADDKINQSKLLRKEIRALMKEQVDAGVRDLEEAVNNVWQILAMPELSPDDVRDIFSGIGVTWELNDTEAKKALAEMRRQAQLYANIDRVQAQLEPLKSGPQRDKQSDLVRQLTKKLNRLKKEAGFVRRSSRGLASALDAKRTRLENAIYDIEEALASGRRLETSTGKQVLSSPEIEELQKQYNALKEEYNIVFPKDEVTPEERLERAIRAMELNVAKIEQTIIDVRSGKAPKQNNRLPISERLEQLKQKRSQLKLELSELREMLNPGAKALADKKARVNAAIKMTQKMIDTGNFEKPAPRSVAEDQELMDAQSQLASVRKRLAAMKEQARREARTMPETIKEGLLDVYDASRDLIASFDFSAFGNQSYLLVLSHPIIGMKAFAKMMKSVSRNEIARDWQRFTERPNYKLYEKYRLGISKGDGTGNFTVIEDRFAQKLVNAIPGVGMSGRAFATMLNHLRADVFDKLYEGSDKSPESAMALAEGVNNLSGRGAMQDGSARHWARFIWAPRFLTAAFNVLTFRPWWTGTAEARKLMAKEYLRVGSSMAVIYLLAMMFHGDDDEWYVDLDPRSSSFGAIKISDSYVLDVLGWSRPLLTFIARTVTGVTVSKAGGKQKLRNVLTAFEGDAEDAKPFGKDWIQVAARFAQTKLHPVLGAFVSLASGKQFNGKDVSVASFVSDMTVPLSARSVWETYHIEDPAAATALATAQIMGVRVRPDYDSPAFMQYDAASESDYKKKVAKIIVAGTDPKSTESEKAYMKNIVSEMSSDEQIKILKDFWLEKHGNTRIYKANGFTSLGRRIAEIKARKEK